MSVLIVKGKAYSINAYLISGKQKRGRYYLTDYMQTIFLAFSHHIH